MDHVGTSHFTKSRVLRSQQVVQHIFRGAEKSHAAAMLRLNVLESHWELGELLGGSGKAWGGLQKALLGTY